MAAKHVLCQAVFAVMMLVFIASVSGHGRYSAHRARMEARMEKSRNSVRAVPLLYPRRRPSRLTTTTSKPSNDISWKNPVVAKRLDEKCSSEAVIKNPNNIRYTDDGEIYMSKSLADIRNTGFTLLRYTKLKPGVVNKNHAFDIYFRTRQVSPTSVQVVSDSGHKLKAVAIGYGTGYYDNPTFHHVKTSDGKVKIFQLRGDGIVKLELPYVNTMRIYPQEWEGQNPSIRSYTFKGCE